MKWIVNFLIIFVYIFAFNTASFAATVTSIGSVAQAAAVSTSVPLTTTADCPASSAGFILIGSGGTATQPSTVSDNATGGSNAYNGLTLTTIVTTGKLKGYYWKSFGSHDLPLGGIITAVMNTSTNGVVIAGVCITGILVQSAAVLDIDTGATAGTGNPTLTTAATVSANEIMFELVEDSVSGDTYTPSSGFTHLTTITSATSTRVFYLDYKILTSTGVQTLTPSFGNATRQWGLNAASFLITPPLTGCVSCNLND